MSMLVPFRLDARIAEYYRDLLPEIRAEINRFGEQSVQLIVWLVGLATGITALLVSQLSSQQPVIGSRAASWTIALLAASVVLGVLHRILYHMAEVATWSQLLNFRGYLLGLTDPSSGPLELEEYWDVARIAQELNEEFGLDYSFLVEYNVPIERAREIYTSVYDRHNEREKEGLRRLADVVGETFGIPEDKRHYFGEPAPKGHSVREQGQYIRALHRASSLLFLGTAICFIASVITVVAGIIRDMPRP